MSKKPREDYAKMAANPIKQWKETPPGPAQKELDRMFNNKIIKNYDTPNDIRKINPMFMEYSAKVFAVHFRKTKAKHGLFTEVDPEIESNKIPELGDESFESNTCNNSKKNYNSFEESKENSLIEFLNPPIAIWTYCDHEKNYDNVYVVVPIISGSTNINFTLSEDGRKVSINYNWQTAIFKPNELFQEEIVIRKKITANHPKVHALQTHFLENGITKKSNPTGHITITLPMEVQREVGSWSKQAINKADGTKIVLLEFKGYQQNKIIEDADTTINFD